MSQDCSLIYLLDENLCLKDSLDVINYNVTSLSGSLFELETYANKWNQAYTTFTANSATWLIISSHLQSYNKLWNSAHTTVQTLSSNWGKEFTLFYPTVIELDDWYAQTPYYTNTVLGNWLSTNFPARNHLPNQIVLIQTSLSHQQPFSFNFSKSYIETCGPQGGVTVTCQPCGLPNRGCNHHGGRAGFGPCTNAYTHCGQDVQAFLANFSCGSTGGRTLTLSKDMNSTDTSIVRIVTTKYQNINNTWRVL